MNASWLFTDIDECTIGTHYCIDSEICVNLNGTYECVCKDGFRLQSGYCKGLITTSILVIKIREVLVSNYTYIPYSIYNIP